MRKAKPDNFGIATLVAIVLVCVFSPIIPTGYAQGVKLPPQLTGDAPRIPGIDLGAFGEVPRGKHVTIRTAGGHVYEGKIVSTNGRVVCIEKPGVGGAASTLARVRILSIEVIE